MLNFTRKLLTQTIRTSLKLPIFVNTIRFSTSLDPMKAKIKEVFLSKGKDSQQYQQEMSKAMRQLLQKYDYQSAMGLQKFHLSLLKQTQGDTSQLYRSQLRQITRFALNRQDYQGALQLVKQLQEIESRVPNISPLDTTATLYLLGFVYMNMDKNQQAKKCFEKCLQQKHVKEGPEVGFKIRAELARVYIKLGELDKVNNQIKFLQENLKTRNFDSKSPQMIIIMQLHDIFNVCELATMMNNKQLSEKYLKVYEQQVEKLSNKKDGLYVQFLERKAKAYFNLRQYQTAIDYLTKASALAAQIAKIDKRFTQNVEIYNNIIESIKKQHLK